ncbi:hypothetical protein WMF19_42720 [Sorangium sp. So ce124]
MLSTSTLTAAAVATAGNPSEAAEAGEAYGAERWGMGFTPVSAAVEATVGPAATAAQGAAATPSASPTSTRTSSRSRA